MPGDLPEETGYTFWMPHLYQLYSYYEQECFLFPPAVRSRPDGRDIVIDLGENVLTVYSLPRRQLLAKVFEAFAITATPSSAGLVTDRLIRQMGGLP